jgi:hypothetical protein
LLHRDKARGAQDGVSTFLAVTTKFPVSAFAKYRIRLNLVDESSERPKIGVWGGVLGAKFLPPARL